MTTPDDQLIKDFFDQMKENDRKVEVPKIYPEMLLKKKGRSRKFLLGIAASVTLLLGAGYVVSIQNEKDSLSNSELLIMEDEIESMMSWSSATNELIEK